MPVERMVEKARNLLESGKVERLDARAVLITGYARGQLTVQEFLTYLGVSGAGGVWGMLGGASSSKT